MGKSSMLLKMQIKLLVCHSDLPHLVTSQEEIYVARASGRLDVMGGIADYSGSLVLQVSLLPRTFVQAAGMGFQRRLANPPLAKGE